MFANLTICIPTFYTSNENQVRGWNPVDDVLNRFSACADVALIITAKYWVADRAFEDLIRTYFPLMWKSGKVVLEVPPPDMEDRLLSEVPEYHWLEIGM